MAKRQLDEMFSIISYRTDRWLIETIFKESDLDEEMMLERFRDIKSRLSKKVNVPPALLFFENLIEKKRIEDGFRVRFDIIRMQVKGGHPSIKIQEVVSLEGIVFPNMKAIMELFYVDPFDNQISLDQLEEIIKKSNINQDLVYFDKLHEAFKTLQNGWTFRIW